MLFYKLYILRKCSSKRSEKTNISVSMIPSAQSKNISRVPFLSLCQFVEREKWP